MNSISEIEDMADKNAIFKDIIKTRSLLWLNPDKRNREEMSSFPIDQNDMMAAAKLWERFAPFIMEAFPETAESAGIIESPLVKIPEMQKLLEKKGDFKGKLLLKCDNDLPVTGSIKARGGFFEVLHYAEELVLKEGLLQSDANYKVFASQRFRDFFRPYRIGVASTGNLGLSIGMMSAALGFSVTVYMSNDAKTWKKNLLKEKGAEVIQFPGNFSEAITRAREEIQKDPRAHFVDDEDSPHLFLGYTSGAIRIAKQLQEQGIKVDENHPLFVYSPCGVGGSPGGTAFGLKQVFGDHVHCFFAEPTHSPAVLIGLITGKMNEISVEDIGLDGLTEADGLAVARPSKFATRISKEVVSGVYTISDDTLFRLLAELKDTEDIFLEPSATPGLIGPSLIAQTDYARQHGLIMKNATHIAWATGGDLVPDKERTAFYRRGNAVLQKRA